MKMRTLQLENKKEMKAAIRIWKECGWVSDDEKDKKGFNLFLKGGNNQIVEMNGEPECLIVFTPGSMRFNNKELSLSAVSAVTVSRLLRKQGAASELLASMILQDMEKGVDVVGLGMFEQGYYNRLGFTTMGYEHWLTFDPAKLKVYKKGGVPVRLTIDHWKSVHKNLSERIMPHGSVVLDPPVNTKAEMTWSKNGFGLGYKKNGKLTHHVWFSAEDVESGPYYIRWMAYSNWDQFLELMGLLKSLEEQVRAISMREPAFIQLQDFIDKPFQLQTITRKSKFESRMRSIAYQQLRIMNLENCIKAVCHEGNPFSFNLSLTDPLDRYLPQDKQGLTCTGDYTVSIGPASTIDKGHTEGLPTVKGSVSGFTRLWIGTIPASTVGLTEDLEIDTSLMKDLEKAFYKPYARSDWDF